MMVLFDSTFLIQLLQATASPAMDRENVPVSNSRERIEYLVRKLGAEGTVICVPAPVIAEVMVLGNKEGAKYFNEMKRSSKFFLAPFDVMAAIESWELIAMMRTKKQPGEHWSKIKFDCQIAAIAKCNQIGLIYSDDNDIAAHGVRLGITVTKTCDLEVPPPPTPLVGHQTDVANASQGLLPLQTVSGFAQPIRPRPEFLVIPGTGTSHE